MPAPGHLPHQIMHRQTLPAPVHPPVTALGVLVTAGNHTQMIASDVLSKFEPQHGQQLQQLKALQPACVTTHHNLGYSVVNQQLYYIAR